MCSSKGHISEVIRPITSLYLGEEMTDKDFKNIEDIQRILKYLDKEKLDATQAIRKAKARLQASSFVS